MLQKIYNITMQLQTHLIVSYFLQGSDQERYNGKSQENQNGWTYGFGRANVWYASEEDSRLQDYLARLEKQINEYDGENWIDKYAE